MPYYSSPYIRIISVCRWFAVRLWKDLNSSQNNRLRILKKESESTLGSRKFAQNKFNCSTECDALQLHALMMLRQCWQCLYTDIGGNVQRPHTLNNCVNAGNVGIHWHRRQIRNCKFWRIIDCTKTASFKESSDLTLLHGSATMATEIQYNTV